MNGYVCMRVQIYLRISILQNIWRHTNTHAQALDVFSIQNLTTLFPLEEAPQDLGDFSQIYNTKHGNKKGTFLACFNLCTHEYSTRLQTYLDIYWLCHQIHMMHMQIYSTFIVHIFTLVIRFYFVAFA